MKYMLQSSQIFNKWWKKLRDRKTKAKILARLARIENGHFGDYKMVKANLYELRFHFGGGLRIYYTVRENQIVLLLVGGTKASQQRDIQNAEKILKDVE